MTLRINAEAPNFTAETTEGSIDFHDWIGDSWAILFSHPKDFTPVCTTELGYMAGLASAFAERNTKILGLSVDPVGNHREWFKDIEETQGHAVTYPLVGDPGLKVAKLYDMLPEGAGDTSEGRTAADNATVRSVFVIGPDKKIKAMLTYPMSTGRNFDEVMRLLDSIQLTAKHSVATPVTGNGDDCIHSPAVSTMPRRRVSRRGTRRTLSPLIVRSPSKRRAAPMRPPHPGPANPSGPDPSRDRCERRAIAGRSRSLRMMRADPRRPVRCRDRPNGA